LFACVDVSPPYPALRDAFRLAFCTVGKPPSIVNTRSQLRVIGEVVALVALLSGIALSPEVHGRYGRLSKNRDLVSVLRVRTSWSSASLPSPASHALDPLAPYCCIQLAPYCLFLPPPWASLSSGILSGSDALSPVTRDHARGAVISTGRPLVYPLWLAPPLLSGSPRRVAPLALFTRYAIYSTVATRAGYGIPWYCTISLGVPKVWRAPITGRSACVSVLPLSR